MAEIPKLTGDNMAFLVDSLKISNTGAMKYAAMHIKACHVKPEEYQAALGEIIHRLLQQKELIEQMEKIIDANNKKRLRYRAKPDKKQSGGD